MTAHLHAKGKLTEFNVSRQMLANITLLFMLSETLQDSVPSAVVQPPASPEKRQQSQFRNIAYTYYCISFENSVLLFFNALFCFISGYIICRQNRMLHWNIIKKLVRLEHNYLCAEFFDTPYEFNMQCIMK